MYQYIYDLDRWLFIRINHLPHNFFFDNVFASFSGIGVRIILWFLAGFLLFIYEGRNDKRGLLAQFIALIIQFLSISLLMKNYFQRLRPEFSLPEVRVIYDSVENFSFPSTHSAFAFSMAYILSMRHKRFAAPLYAFAFSVALSRVYLGKHYPSDVMVGAILGTVIGFVSLKVAYLFKTKSNIKKKQK